MVPRKNSELIIFDLEKSMDNIFIILRNNITSEKIENKFCDKNFSLGTQKKYSEDANVYLIEVAYKKDVLIIFLNERESDEYNIYLGFDNAFNIKYKYHENDDLK